MKIRLNKKNFEIDAFQFPLQAETTEIKKMSYIY